jgi:hypothetical protein
MLAKVKRAVERSPYSDATFLKSPFLSACEAAKLIRVSSRDD